MTVGIVVYSHTGNTLAVAEGLRDRLHQMGYDANLMRVKTPEDYRPGKGSVSEVELPDISGCETLVFASPVHAFSLAQVMGHCIREIDIPQGAKAAGLVTQHLPYAWLGGNRALRGIKKMCSSRGCDYLGGAIVSWSRRDRETKIREAIDQLARTLTSSGV
ncbi:MAG: flavodoxin family protein [Bacillota bacterium]